MDQNIKLEILEKMSALITAGLGLVAALAWNDAIQKLFRLIFGEQSSLAAMFGYAILITVIVVSLTYKIGRASQRLKDQLGKNKK
ncbi:hypothetical protein A3H03_01260 [Candidatus Kuenenbacteria bacterium RIFCSPLOWO2_12_FULL_42_13]|uniref:Uncharacterized protein n=5 Tax=Candidatus Kueneniibacteriota TaxID=1752740 RepID=A0A0G0Z1C1_9BACT|nr:MAG: hypothetical protein UV02_C0011G0017 [Candidatus Kuenenbacteria bacterium GW2011_GWA2_42_15]OGG90181.1 MAG: hypothetical protein A3C68_02390 [Candidatus Kuenenbacteria bacterium RIFCSPHIGHO2_02_FULL_42_29]OGG90954.1 MAG: hypothetical protein A3H55_02805 [Candidatus Kuenenbacteria bacterium RIFCSPLOWO2_02_FULL_42_16]OGG92086.1 MAG: hypothetical protein A3H03_01260 [Candidatus Kuenenbacteria bacterium RIFCSPLOWO2_12_FULL_42_13]OGG96160.1 MAG: hypothetical protein A2V95_02315 [Candidatus K